MDYKAKTFSLHLHELPEKLYYSSVYTLIRVTLKVAPNEVNCIQFLNDLLVHVSVKSSEILERVLDEFKDVFPFEINGKSYRVFIRREQSMTLVRLEGLSFGVPDDVVKHSLSQFGRVLDIKKQIWKETLPFEIYNGIRIVNMLISKRLPQCLDINGEHVVITHQGQNVQCQNCSNAKPIQRENITNNQQANFNILPQTIQNQNMNSVAFFTPGPPNILRPYAPPLPVFPNNNFVRPMSYIRLPNNNNIVKNPPINATNSKPAIEPSHSPLKFTKQFAESLDDNTQINIRSEICFPKEVKSMPMEKPLSSIFSLRDEDLKEEVNVCDKKSKKDKKTKKIKEVNIENKSDDEGKRNSSFYENCKPSTSDSN